MSALFVFDVMGLFPVAGQDVYLIGSPIVPRTVLTLGNGSTFAIEAPETSAENKYIVAATLNGHPLDRAWLRHAEIAGGGTLVLTLASQPGKWPSGPLPPSLSMPPR